MKVLLIAILFALLTFAPAFAQDAPVPTPTYSADVLATQTALEAAIDALPVVDQLFTPTPEVTAEPDAGVIINIDTAPNVDAPPETPAAPEIDWLGRTMSAGAIISVIVGLILFWRERRSIPATVNKANTELTTNTDLQTSLHNIFVHQNTAVQDATLRGLAFGALLTSWTPDKGDDLLLSNINAILTGQPLSAPVVAQTTPQATTVTISGVSRAELQRELNRYMDDAFAGVDRPAGPQAPSDAEAALIAAQTAARADVTTS